ncbi:MAG: redoxin domain-containing protein [Xanthomonadaceae bacterium]|nr:redoxin domain-containing protein [Xanthomonadaceae bacterium]
MVRLYTGSGGKHGVTFSLWHSHQTSQKGDEAPGFKLQDEKGEWLTLGSLTTKGPAVLVFYPGDFRMVCTQQLCSYQDAMNEFKKFGVQIVGISANPPSEHLQF